MSNADNAPVPTPLDVMGRMGRFYSYDSDAAIAVERAQREAAYEREERIAALPRITESKAYRKAARRAGR
jgi:hypothetical protein